MTTEWDDSPEITREMWRERARKLERLLAAERESHAVTSAALVQVLAERRPPEPVEVDPYWEDRGAPQMGAGRV